MKINQKMNIVINFDDGDGNAFYIHATPLSREAFEHNYLLLSQCLSYMSQQGIQLVAGPRVASLVLKEIATSMDKIGDYNAIISEVRRLSTVIRPNRDGWEGVPLSTLISREEIAPEDVTRAESAIVFFMLASALWSGQVKKETLNLMNGLWQTQNTSLSALEFTDSLRTSTAGESSGAKVG